MAGIELYVECAVPVYLCYYYPYGEGYQQYQYDGGGSTTHWAYLLCEHVLGISQGRTLIVYMRALS